MSGRSSCELRTPSGVVQVVVARSAGTDGAVVVLIDTDFEPNGSDGGPGLRVLLNDSDAYIGKPYRGRKSA